MCVGGVLRAEGSWLWFHDEMRIGVGVGGIDVKAPPHYGEDAMLNTHSQNHLSLWEGQWQMGKNSS